MVAVLLFIDHLTVNQLIVASLMLFATSVLLVILIFVYLAIKKRRFNIEKNIDESLDNWITENILNDDESIIEVSEQLKTYFDDQKNHQFVINRLIAVRRNFSGSSLDKIVKLYQQFDFKNDSLKKIHSRHWFKKARGIYELYMMNQLDMEHEIAKHTNSPNEYIRMEAQTAIISFHGFEGLNFLETLTQPITEWHQLKLMEQLNGFSVQVIQDISKWLKSENKYVVMFALKLTAVYQQLQVHDEVAVCLIHPLEKIRTQAILALAAIANDDTASLLINHYPTESHYNQKTILQKIKNLVDDRNRDFLIAQLDNLDNDFKLIVAEILIRNFEDGLKVLEKKAETDPVPFKDIFMHAKRTLYELV